MTVTTRPATSFDDVRTMVGPKRPDANVCWCLSYRLTSSKENREVVGWAAVHPRRDTSFARSRTIPHVDDLDVWSIWCIRVRPGHRGRGISHTLLAGAVDLARDAGAPAVEGYPVDNDGATVEQTMAYVGTKALFETAGFTQAAETTSRLAGHPRVLMRLDLRG